MSSSDTVNTLKEKRALEGLSKWIKQTKSHRRQTGDWRILTMGVDILSRRNRVPYLEKYGITSKVMWAWTMVAAL